MNTRAFKTIISSAIFGLLFTGVNYAQSQQNGQRKEPPTIDQIFEQMDKDEDGQLSEDEVKGPLKNDFAKIDADENGLLSREEVEKAPKPEGKGPR